MASRVTVNGRRTGLSVSLRGVLLLFAITAIPLATWVNRAHRQRESVRAILACRGTVRYGPNAMGTRHDVFKKLGPDFSQSVVSVSLSQPSSKSVYQHVGHLRQLRSLFVFSDTLDNRDMVHLGRLKRLRVLMLVGNTPRLTSDGLRHLKHLRELQSLQLVGVIRSAEGLDFLEGKDDLFKLVLRHAGLDDDTFLSMPALPALATLDVADTQLTDIGLQRILESSSIQYLDVGATKVGDASAPRLARRGQLRCLVVELSEARRAELRRALPNCAITDTSPSVWGPLVFRAVFRRIDYGRWAAPILSY